ncbi:MAG: hypothetical protein Q4C40_02830 [Eubacteriales bacterium]|nr:hypothetical protein [Eubacteriales bacterium]
MRKKAGAILSVGLLVTLLLAGCTSASPARETNGSADFSGSAVRSKETGAAMLPSADSGSGSGYAD